MFRLRAEARLSRIREAVMEESCELLEKCGFFNNFKGNSEVIKAGWVRMFCQSKEKSERCKRKAYARRPAGRRGTTWPPPASSSRSWTVGRCRLKGEETPPAAGRLS